jgi:hypothetical protein
VTSCGTDCVVAEVGCDGGTEVAVTVVPPYVLVNPAIPKAKAATASAMIEAIRTPQHTATFFLLMTLIGITTAFSAETPDPECTGEYCPNLLEDMAA